MTTRVSITKTDDSGHSVLVQLHDNNHNVVQEFTLKRPGESVEVHVWSDQHVAVKEVP